MRHIFYSGLLLILLNSCIAAPTFHPEGVNFGGLFVLEDWFFSNASGVAPDHLGVYVATPCGHSVGSSQIFLKDSAAPLFYWTSETNLISQLRTAGYSDSEITAAFEKHRSNFLMQQVRGPQNLDQNFLLLHNLGVTKVRLPVTWALIYPNQTYTLTGAAGSVVVPASTQTQLINDPFFAGEKWAGIPVEEIAIILRAAARYHIKVLIDIHAYPGGSGEGTYNGIWPNSPLFWNGGTVQYRQNFNTIVANLIQWTESLYQTDPAAARGLWGISPMNEPAHLLGIPAATCDPSAPWFAAITYQDVLDTLALSVTSFRNSSLPAHGAKLDMNIIETMFPISMTAAAQYNTIGAWWMSITSALERSAWAVLDIHHYAAWDPNCNQCINESVSNGSITQAGFVKIAACTNWYLQLRNALNLEEKAQLNVSEFSAGTNQYTQNSCSSGVGPNVPLNHQAYRDAYFKDQLINAKRAGLTMFFWSWVFPYNMNFQSEWSLYTLYNQQRQ